MGNERKNATLGMPFGTACGRLRKLILFHLICRLEENICFKCHKPIERVEDLSIEPNLPWEGILADLFWDLNNIAFSHLRCNVPHVRRGGEPQRKIGPPGTAWCAYHEIFEPRENFYPAPENWHGLRNQCKTGRYERTPKVK
jgi:hypothetical protein